MSMDKPKSALPAAILGLSPGGFLSLAAVLAVLVVVSLPRLHGLALRENQGDARTTVEVLARALNELAPEERGLPLLEVARRTRVERTLRDAEWLEDGRVLRLHGYLFERCSLPATGVDSVEKVALSAGTGQEPLAAAVRAWPWSDATGQTVFVATTDGRVRAHDNEAATWGGLGSRPNLPAPLDPAWREAP
jgi:hypothetical protein